MEANAEDLLQPYRDLGYQGPFIGNSLLEIVVKANYDFPVTKVREEVTALIVAFRQDSLPFGPEPRQLLETIAKACWIYCGTSMVAHQGFEDRSATTRNLMEQILALDHTRNMFVPKAEAA